MVLVESQYGHLSAGSGVELGRAYAAMATLAPDELPDEPETSGAAIVAAAGPTGSSGASPPPFALGCWPCCYTHTQACYRSKEKEKSKRELSCEYPSR